METAAATVVTAAEPQPERVFVRRYCYIFEYASCDMIYRHRLQHQHERQPGTVSRGRPKEGGGGLTVSGEIRETKCHFFLLSGTLCAATLRNKGFKHLGHIRSCSRNWGNSVCSGGLCQPHYSQQTANARLVCGRPKKGEGFPIFLIGNLG